MAKLRQYSVVCMNISDGMKLTTVQVSATDEKSAKVEAKKQLATLGEGWIIAPEMPNTHVVMEIKSPDLDTVMANDKRKIIETIQRYCGQTNAVTIANDKNGWLEVWITYTIDIGGKIIKIRFIVHTDYFDINGFSRTGYFNLAVEGTPKGMTALSRIKTGRLIMTYPSLNPYEIIFEYTWEKSGFSATSPVIHNLTDCFDDALEQFCADMTTNINQGSYFHYFRVANELASL